MVGLRKGVGAHAGSHEDGGADEIDVTGLDGVLSEDQHVIDAEVLAAVAAADDYVEKIGDDMTGALDIDVDTNVTESSLVADIEAFADSITIKGVHAICRKGFGITGPAIGVESELTGVNVANTTAFKTTGAWNWCIDLAGGTNGINMHGLLLQMLGGTIAGPGAITDCGNIGMAAGATVDGVDVSAHAADAWAHQHIEAWYKTDNGSYTFGTAFSATPAVTIGNRRRGETILDQPYISAVSTTACTIFTVNGTRATMIAVEIQ